MDFRLFWISFKIQTKMHNSIKKWLKHIQTKRSFFAVFDSVSGFLLSWFGFKHPLSNPILANHLDWIRGPSDLPSRLSDLWKFQNIFYFSSLLKGFKEYFYRGLTWSLATYWVLLGGPLMIWYFFLLGIWPDRITSWYYLTILWKVLMPWFSFYSL